jgi:hypothetical protein
MSVQQTSTCIECVRCATLAVRVARLWRHAMMYRFVSLSTDGHLLFEPPRQVLSIIIWLSFDALVEYFVHDTYYSYCTFLTAASSRHLIIPNLAHIDDICNRIRVDHRHPTHHPASEPLRVHKLTPPAFLPRPLTSPNRTRYFGVPPDRTTHLPRPRHSNVSAGPASASFTRIRDGRTLEDRSKSASALIPNPATEAASQPTSLYHPSKNPCSVRREIVVPGGLSPWLDDVARSWLLFLCVVKCG